MTNSICPTCGASAYVKQHHVGERASFAVGEPAEDVSLECCNICAVEARRQLDAANATEVVEDPDVTRADAVADSLIF